MQSCHVCQKQIACNEEESIYGSLGLLNLLLSAKNFFNATFQDRTIDWLGNEIYRTQFKGFFLTGIVLRTDQDGIFSDTLRLARFRVLTAGGNYQTNTR
jgi:hypothetical protein